LNFLYQESPFLDRFERAASSGFEAVEFLFPYDWAPEEIRTRLDKHNLVQALFNFPPGDWEGGERGIAALPGRETEFERSIRMAALYAEVLNCNCLHVMAGITKHNPDQKLVLRTYVENIRRAADALRDANRMILLEPLNNTDVPGYLVTTPKQAIELIDEIARPNVGLQLDFYQCQMMQGNLATTFEMYHEHIKHIQIAGVPGRHEPDVGEINYSYLLELVDRFNYSGYVGCEYNPLTSTKAGLGWLKPYLVNPEHIHE
jgi:hydroxypyruvate isomerase